MRLGLGFGWAFVPLEEAAHAGIGVANFGVLRAGLELFGDFLGAFDWGSHVHFGAGVVAVSGLG